MFAVRRTSARTEPTARDRFVDAIRVGTALATRAAMHTWSARFRVRDAASIAIDAVPQLVTDVALPLSDDELAVIHQVDELRSVGEIAQRASVTVERVSVLLLELAWAGAVTFDEVTDVDEIDIISELDDAPPEPEPIPLARPRDTSGSVLIQAVLAALADLA